MNTIPTQRHRFTREQVKKAVWLVLAAVVIGWCIHAVAAIYAEPDRRQEFTSAIADEREQRRIQEHEALERLLAIGCNGVIVETSAGNYQCAPRVGSAVLIGAK